MSEVVVLADARLLPPLHAHEDCRGPAVVQLGYHLAQHDGIDTIDAAVIGRSVDHGGYHPQTLKQLWHLTAQWGQPRT